MTVMSIDEIGTEYRLKKDIIYILISFLVTLLNYSHLMLKVSKNTGSGPAGAGWGISGTDNVRASSLWMIHARTANSCQAIPNQ